MGRAGNKQPSHALPVDRYRLLARILWATVVHWGLQDAVYPPLLGVAIRIVNRRDGAEEVPQDAFITLRQRIGLLAPKYPIDTPCGFLYPSVN